MYFCKNKLDEMVMMVDLYFGLVEYQLEQLVGGELKWILAGDIQGLIPIIRLKGKYGIFRPSFRGMGMGVDIYYATKNPFKYTDVKICVPKIGYGYSGFVAVERRKKWAVLYLHIDTHPLTIVEQCDSFDAARVEFESIIGRKSPYPWQTFEEYEKGNTWFSYIIT